VSGLGGGEVVKPVPDSGIGFYFLFLVERGGRYEMDEMPEVRPPDPSGDSKVPQLRLRGQESIRKMKRPKPPRARPQR